MIYYYFYQKCTPHPFIMSPLTRNILALALLGGMFVLVSYATAVYKPQLEVFVEIGGWWGMLGYILLTIVSVVFVLPLDIPFLIPLGAHLYGAPTTALMSITGWTIGYGIAFGIARRYGVTVVEKMIGLERVRAVERRIPTQNLFWSVVTLRMLVSVDILSYALGLFSSISWRSYLLATAIGVTPFGFYFAYAGTLPLHLQILAIAAALILATVVVFYYRVPREP